MMFFAFCSSRSGTASPFRRSSSAMIAFSTSAGSRFSRSSAKTKRGEAYDQSYCFIFRFRGDQVVEVDERFDSALVNRVLS